MRLGARSGGPVMRMPARGISSVWIFGWDSRHSTNNGIADLVNGSCIVNNLQRTQIRPDLGTNRGTEVLRSCISKQDSTVAAVPVGAGCLSGAGKCFTWYHPLLYTQESCTHIGMAYERVHQVRQIFQSQQAVRSRSRLTRSHKRQTAPEF